MKFYSKKGTWEEKFWSRVEKTPDCWWWRGVITRYGYGSMGRQGRPLRAHRVSWELTNGPIPPSMLVCHHCDNRACVRPDHLFLGTNADNSQDMVRKGRQPLGPRKLTADEVEEARRLLATGATKSDVARALGVARGTIVFIAQGKTWSRPFRLTRKAAGRTSASVE